PAAKAPDHEAGGCHCGKCSCPLRRTPAAVGKDAEGWSARHGVIRHRAGSAGEATAKEAKGRQ
ncbi:unnamed protein product, partial [Symbiodinium necroappetens]